MAEPIDHQHIDSGQAQKHAEFIIENNGLTDVIAVCDDCRKKITNALGETLVKKIKSKLNRCEGINLNILDLLLKREAMEYESGKNFILNEELDLNDAKEIKRRFRLSQSIITARDKRIEICSKGIPNIPDKMEQDHAFGESIVELIATKSIEKVVEAFLSALSGKKTVLGDEDFLSKYSHLSEEEEDQLI